MDGRPRLIETSFPLREVSADSVHEKNVRHGHISTLHIYPARRPLAACRAAILASLLPDPGDKESRDALWRRIAGTSTTDADGKVQTRGGVLHWGREQDETELGFFRDLVRESCGGAAPRVLDPFAGGGAIPLEAMRLGCDVTAADINPVAWFVLRCTLHYPRLLRDWTAPLPGFARSVEFAAEIAERRDGLSKPKAKKRAQEASGRLDQRSSEPLDVEAFWTADLAWHVRAWGQWVLDQARPALAPRYPVVAEWARPDRQPAGAPPPGMMPEGAEHHAATLPGEVERWLAPVPTTPAGIPDVDALNRGLSAHDLSDDGKPRWMPRATVAYLWARTVPCSNPGCGATIPLLKTRKLCHKAGKRIGLALEIDEAAKAVAFRVVADPAQTGGTTNRAGATCPVCGALTRGDRIRSEGRAGRIGAAMTAVVVETPHGKDYRRPTEAELRAADVGASELEEAFAAVPFGIPDEPLPDKEALGIRVPNYGIDRWSKLFTSRQLLAMGRFVGGVRSAHEAMRASGMEPVVAEAIAAYLACAVDRVANRGCGQTFWNSISELTEQTFAKFALPINWAFSEVAPLQNFSGSFIDATDWTAMCLSHLLRAAVGDPTVFCCSSIVGSSSEAVDVILTDPPYYDAIPYSDLMDFFHVWLRRTLHGVSPEFDRVFASPLGPKWDGDAGDGELIDDASRFGGDRAASKANYEDGMRRAFSRCREELADDGRLVVVFASKSSDAWETLIGGLVKAGFAVTASWPIETEFGNRTMGQARAALASSIWIVAKKRPDDAPIGWEEEVLAEMRSRTLAALRDYWDSGIQGPDLIWSAFGPALESYSRYRGVRRQSGAGAMSVPEFMAHVRRFVVEFVLGQVFQRAGADEKDAQGLDPVTAYYLLHRKDFGLGSASIGACILYAQSCGISDTELANRYEVLDRPDKRQAQGDDEDEEEEDGGKKKTQQVRLCPWDRRGLDRPGFGQPDAARPAPLIDQAHRLMQLWAHGEIEGVNEYVAHFGLQYHQPFLRVLQALTELSKNGERQVLEQAMNYLKGVRRIEAPATPAGVIFQPVLAGFEDLDPASPKVRERRKSYPRNKKTP